MLYSTILRVLGVISGSIRRFGLGTALLGLAVAAAGCNDLTAPPQAMDPAQDGGGSATGALTTTGSGKASPAVTAPFDVGAVIRQVHFAFRPGEAGGFEGGHSTYGVIERGGQVTVTPVHHPTGGLPAAGPGPHLPGRAPSPHLDQPAPIRGGSVTFATERIHRGGLTLDAAEAMSSVDSRGRLTIQRHHVTERWQNSDQGVEQSWRFAGEPEDKGDLTVRVRVSGQPHAGQTAAGIHFTDRTTGLGLRYGQATWIDAAGTRTAVTARFEDGAITLTVPAAVVERSAYPAVLDPIISPEFGVDTPAQAPAWGAQRLPAVASDGTDYFVVWDDYRHQKTASYDIYGARVSAAGKVLDPAGILISDMAGHQYSPSVAHDGTRFLVAWHDHRNHATYPDIYAARVTNSGQVQEPGGFPVTTAVYHQYYPEIAVGGGNFMLVWQDYRNGGSYANIYGARVSGAGVVLDKSSVLISGASHHQVTPKLAFDGTNFMVVWMDYRKSYWKYTYTDIYGARVSTAGTLLDKSGVAICTQGNHQYYPSISYTANGSSFLVVWQDYRNYSKKHWDIYGRLVSPAGTLKGIADIAITSASGHQLNPVVDHNGADFMVLWTDGRYGAAYNIYGRRISPAGALIGGDLAISSASGTQQRPALARAKSGYLAVWEDHRNGTGIKSDIYGARINGTGAVLDPAGLALSTAAPDQLLPAVAHDGTNYLVVWQDYRNNATTRLDIYGAIVGPTGSPVTTTAFPISKAANNQMAPAVTYGGGSYLVVWQDYRSSASYADIYGTQVETSGKVRHPSGVPVSTATGNQVAPAVAHDGTNYLAVWQDYRKSASYPDIYGARLNKFGGVINASGLVISGAGLHQQAPAVAYGAGSYLVVWQDYRNSTASSWDIYGARVSSSGTLLDPKGVPISTAVNNQYAPTLAHDSTNFLVAWQDYRNTAAGTSWDIYGARVSSAGNLLGSSTTGTAISVSGGDQLRPRAASAKSSFLVAWEDYRGGKYNPDIYGTLVSSAGAVQSKLGEVLSASAGYEISPAVASPGQGKYMLTYARFSSAAGDGAFRIRGRLVTELKAGSVACTTGKACKSGFCVDGVCCDTACGGGAAGDCQACSVASGAKADGTCGPVKAGATCRAAAGPCDTIETCDGATLTCKADALKAKGTVCRGALGTCDQAESCSGSSAQCPADLRLPAGTACRAAAGACDKGETCDGAAATCPADTYLAIGKSCRAAVGPCDVAEACSGMSPQCPSDQFKGASAVCRAAAGECDVAESCSGASGSCPADLFKAEGTGCSKGQCVKGQCLAADAGPADAGPEAGPDSGPAPDATPAPDAGEPDAKVMTPDQGALKPDSKSVGSEGAVVDPGDEEGCSCRAGGDGDAGPTGTGALLALALAMALLRPRRRR